MLKILGFICIVLSGGLCGAFFSDRLRKLRDSCHELVQILLKINSLIRYRCMSVYEIVAELKNTDSFKNTEFIYSLPEEYNFGEDFHILWNKAVLNDPRIGDEERVLLGSFGAEFGSSDTEGQLMLIESTIESIKELEKQRSQIYMTKGKLYRSVGILFGIMAGIMIV